MHTNITTSAGVHITHCCKRHGCKYGDDDCPVVLGTHEQDQPCESCDDTELAVVVKVAVSRFGVLAGRPTVKVFYGREANKRAQAYVDGQGDSRSDFFITTDLEFEEGAGW